MSSPPKKPLNFAQALRARPGQDNQQATSPDSQLSTNTENQQPTELDSRLPLPSLLPTETVEVASRQAPRRKVERHRPRKVDSRKGDRHSGDRVPFNNRLSAETVKRIKLFCIEHGMEQQEFAELAAIHFMDFVDSHPEENLDSRLSLDDRELMILFKTQPSIINLYLQYNPDNRWRPADDIEGQRYNGRDIRLIEVGIIQTQFNARFKKINSFKYYTTEIDITLETPLQEETIEVMLKHARRRWELAKNQT